MRMREKAILFYLVFAIGGIFLAVQIERWLQLGGVALLLLLPVGGVFELMTFRCPHCGDTLLMGPHKPLDVFCRQCYSCGKNI
ncbi:hypothetical protein [Thalassolituus marinus]|uniref:Uncharacterized protein n=1 Tax=Thalassolituus marinus TaxID=671053 RepID=A0ABS7ZKZ8_9GAMM|nr:hypothetical protein [Thalassolituus marinus]MCA6062391.1 hypothetical protein [Thalassolituus marinus]